jgi:flavin-dependent dehydrogenase
VKVGYAWCFPLGEQKYHIGCANLLEDPRESLMHLGWLEQAQKRTTPVCTCSGSVRIASVHQSRPFVAGNIWGVGEAIGCVSPLVGEGIVPGLESAEILLRHWNDPEQYTQTILETFSWMRKEREVVDRLFAGKSPGIRDAWIIRKNSKRMGIRFSRAQLLHLVRVLR